MIDYELIRSFVNVFIREVKYKHTKKRKKTKY